MFRTIKTNWREIAAFILIGLIFAALSDIVLSWAAETDRMLGVASIINYLGGFSAFVGANLAAVLGLAMWQTVNGFYNTGFKNAWLHLPQGQKLWFGLAVVGIYGLMAAICFAR